MPNKLPPLKQPMPVTALPMLGYLEQTVATAILNALSAVGTVKPKFPFISSTSSALLFVAYHLKGEEYPAFKFVFMYRKPMTCVLYTCVLEPCRSSR